MKCLVNKLLSNIENSENLLKIKEFVIWYGLYNYLVETPVLFAVKGDCIATIETEGVTFCTSDGTPLTNLERCTKTLYLIPNKEIKIVIDNVWNITATSLVTVKALGAFDIDIFKYSNNIDSLWATNDYCTGSASIFLYLKLIVSINISSNNIKNLDTSYFKDCLNIETLLLNNSTGTLMNLTKLILLTRLRILLYEDILPFFKELIKNGYPQELRLEIDSYTININSVKYSAKIYYLRHDGTTIYITGTNVDLQFPID